MGCSIERNIQNTGEKMGRMLVEGAVEVKEEAREMEKQYSI